MYRRICPRTLVWLITGLLLAMASPVMGGPALSRGTLVFSVLLFLLAGAVIVNGLTLSVLEQQQRIGIFRAVGARRLDIAFIFLIEVAVVGALGSVLGLLIAHPHQRKTPGGLPVWPGTRLVPTAQQEGPVTRRYECVLFPVFAGRLHRSTRTAAHTIRSEAHSLWIPCHIAVIKSL